MYRLIISEIASHQSELEMLFCASFKHGAAFGNKDSQIDI